MSYDNLIERERNEKYIIPSIPQVNSSEIIGKIAVDM